MEILIFSISSPPEKTGIGKYNGELIEYLSEKGRKVTLITTFPYYPEWKILDGYKSGLFSKESKSNLTIARLWSYLPKKVSAKGRIFKEITFFITSLIYLICKRMNGYKPDIVVYVAPPFILPFCTNWIFKKAKHIYHIQDFEVDAAIDLNMLPSFLEGYLLRVEKWLISKMNLISTISEGMVKKLYAKGVSKDVYLFPNWTDSEKIFPEASTWLHKDLGISLKKKLVVYSGNIGEKQGLDKLPKIIEAFSSKKDLHFVIIGEGTFKAKLITLLEKTDCKNYSLRSLVDMQNLNSMLNSSFIQLVLQKNEGGDSFLPSKLTNILAAGIPSVVTTQEGTGLYGIVKNNNCALPVSEDVDGIVNGINTLTNDKALYKELSMNAKSYADIYLNKGKILDRFNNKLDELLLDR